MMKGESTSIDMAGTSKAVVVEKRGFKRGASVADLVLRLGALVSAVAAAATMGSSDQSLPFFTQFFQFEASYDNMPSFQFFLIAMAFVSAYLVLSLPFSIVAIIRPNAARIRLFLIMADTLTLTLATSAGAAATAIVYLAHNGNATSNWFAICNQFTDFCQSISGAVVAAFVCVLTIIFLIFISVVSLRKH